MLPGRYGGKGLGNHVSQQRQQLANRRGELHAESVAVVALLVSLACLTVLAAAPIGTIPRHLACSLSMPQNLLYCMCF